ncbi:MAG: AAA family ATPase [Cyclobacteriaceae bacterium]
MKRKLFQSLVNWKNSPKRKPIVIRGARQVGKTWLMKSFGTELYGQVAYVNFESNQTMRKVFEQDFDTDRLLMAIQIETGIKINATDTLLILDEIQESKGALTSLKYFQENAPSYHVIAAGSLLGVALHRETSFPVGKVEFLDLYPLDFEEFLGATGERSLNQLLHARNWEMIKPFAQKLKHLLKHYFFIGGMPEAVQTFFETKDLELVRSVQNRIMDAYQQDFSKHAPFEIVPRIRMVWNAIPAQLSKENKKFIYGQVKKGARAKDFEMALAWLIDCGLVHQVNRVSKGGLPLKAYQDIGAFKLFLLDIGLLGAMVDLDVKTILEGNPFFEEFNGAISEQFVLQQLVALGLAPAYWSADSATAEVDFVIQLKGQIIPIEVKAEENLKAKSLKVFVEKYKTVTNIRTSLSDYRKEDWLVNIPLYGIHTIV